MTKFDVHWKDIKKDISKVLEQSEDQNKKKHLEKQLQKMVFLTFSTLNQLTWVFVWIKQIFTAFRDFFVGAFLSQFKYELEFHFNALSLVSKPSHEVSFILFLFMNLFDFHRISTIHGTLLSYLVLVKVLQCCILKI